MKSCFLVAVLLCVSVEASFGDSIVVFNDGSNAASAGSDSVAMFGPLAESFSTGASAVSLTDIMVKLNVAQNNAAIGAIRRHSTGTSIVVRPQVSSAPGVTVALYSDNAGLQLGTLISTLGNVPDSSLPAIGMYKNFDFPVNPPIPLTAKTRYWVVFSSTSSVAGLAWTNDFSGGAQNEYNIFRGKLSIPTAAPTKGPIRSK